MIKHVSEQKISLDGEWKLACAPDSKIVADGYREMSDSSLATPTLLSINALEKSGYNIISAKVPGNFELDLQNAGLCDEPYFGINTVELEKYEDTHMYYFRNFDFSGDSHGMKLVFEGIDTAAEVFLNGEKIYECENMFTSHTVDVEKTLKNGANEIVVHIKPTVIYARRYDNDAMTYHMGYNAASLSLRKAAGTYGWDILPRTVSGGLWRSVSLVKYEDVRINDVFGYTYSVNTADKSAKLYFAYNLSLGCDIAQNFRISVDGKCGDSEFHCEKSLWHTSGTVIFDVYNAKYWMPCNYGEPNLYDVTVTLKKYGKTVDSMTFKLGIRTVELVRTSVIENGDGDFCFKINGQRIFVMGTNWVPVDAYHSRDLERLDFVMPMLTDIGCNMVRCWGGNVYENEKFFDFCDENGILVWQDFAMACGAYPQNDEFAEKLKKEVEHVVKKYRGHASLALWAGDNECDQAVAYWNGLVRRDPNTNILTRKIIPSVLSRLDLTRPYLPSSPYVDEYAYKTKLPTSEDHTWGPRDYFKGGYYKNTVCRFASEVGYHGCPNPESVEKFISPEKRWPWRAEGHDYPNDQWLVHAASSDLDPYNIYSYRIQLMESQIVTLFGKTFDNLDDFAKASQISQAEAKKYFIEQYRVQRYRRNGILWWNLIDGWPQFSDAVVDYYGAKKLAYAYIKRSQMPVIITCDEPTDGKISLVCASDENRAVNVRWTLCDLEAPEKILCSGEKEMSAHTTEILSEIDDTDMPKYYLFKWEYEKDGERVAGKNHFVSHMEKTLDLENYIRMMQNAGFGGDSFFLTV